MIHRLRFTASTGRSLILLQVWSQHDESTRQSQSSKPAHRFANGTWTTGATLFVTTDDKAVLFSFTLPSGDVFWLGVSRVYLIFLRIKAMQFLNKHEDQLKRGLTYDLWKNFPAGEIFVRGDASEGVGCKLDVGAAPYAAAGAGAVLAGNGVRAFTDATGTVAGLTQAQYSGGTGFRMTSSVDNEAAELQWGGGGEPFIISDAPADAKELCFECCFRVDSVTANDVAFFIGLAGAGTLDGDMIADNGADIADRDMVGIDVNSRRHDRRRCHLPRYGQCVHCPQS